MVTTIIIIFITYIAYSYVRRSYRDFGIVNSRWYQPFPDTSFSANDLYTSIEESLKKKQISDMRISRITYSQGGIFSSQREYLHIARGQYIFLVCAAPFGTDFFVSWWGGERITFWMDLLPRIPILGLYFEKSVKKKSFYRMDTESMFEGTVRKCVMGEIEKIAIAKGIRGLPDIDRMNQRTVQMQ